MRNVNLSKRFRALTPGTYRVTVFGPDNDIVDIAEGSATYAAYFINANRPTYAEPAYRVTLERLA